MLEIKTMKKVTEKEVHTRYDDYKAELYEAEERLLEGPIWYVKVQPDGEQKEHYKVYVCEPPKKLEDAVDHFTDVDAFWEFEAGDKIKIDGVVIN